MGIHRVLGCTFNIMSRLTTQKTSKFCTIVVEYAASRYIPLKSTIMQRPIPCIDVTISGCWAYRQVTMKAHKFIVDAHHLSPSHLLRNRCLSSKYVQVRLTFEKERHELITTDNVTGCRVINRIFRTCPVYQFAYRFLAICLLIIILESNFSTIQTKCLQSLKLTCGAVLELSSASLIIAVYLERFGYIWNNPYQINYIFIVLTLTVRTNIPT